MHSVPVSLTSKLGLMENFKEYMETQLSCEAPKHSPAQIPPIVSHWKRSDCAIVFYRRELIQINFIADHWKLLLYADEVN